jgi:hypothetical protein
VAVHIAGGRRNGNCSTTPELPTGVFNFRSSLHIVQGTDLDEHSVPYLSTT